MIYCDTSVIVAAIVLEPETARIKAWLREQPPGSLAISDWVETELASALSIKTREGQLSPEQRAAAGRAWRAMMASLFVTLPVNRAHFQQAARLAASPQPPLRGGDSLHLAIAMETSAMATLDRRLATACDCYAVGLAL